MRYVVCDLQASETYETETEARDRAAEWLEYAKDLALACVTEDRETLERWDYYEMCTPLDAIECQIRIYRVDTDVYEGDPEWPDDGDDGVERIEAISTRSEDLLGMTYAEYAESH